MTNIIVHNQEPLVSVNDLGVYYSVQKGMFRHKQFWALKNISFDLYRGESLGIVGRNGSGKSTLLSIMSGIMSQDTGTLMNRAKRTSLLSLQAGFIPHLSGRENAMLAGIFLGLTRREIKSKMDDIIEFAELGEFADQPTSTYSTGMRARLGFAVAFQVNPELLLIDEVTSVGDQAFQQKSFAVLKERLLSDSTIVLVTHHGASVEMLCNRAIWIEHGEICEAGETTKVLDAYHEFIHSGLAGHGL